MKTLILSIVEITGSGYGYLAPPPARSMGRSTSAHDLAYSVSKPSPRHTSKHHGGSQQSVVGHYGSLRKCWQHVILTTEMPAGIAPACFLYIDRQSLIDEVGSVVLGDAVGDIEMSCVACNTHALYMPSIFSNMMCIK